MTAGMTGLFWLWFGLVGSCESTLILSPCCCQEIISGKTGTSILKFLNDTVTTMGRKELSSRIEAPLMDQQDIEGRYDALESCMDNVPLGRLCSGDVVGNVCCFQDCIPFNLCWFWQCTS
jgi:hypothetical protein